jgi:hypothetical protein
VAPLESSANHRGRGLRLTHQFPLPNSFTRPATPNYQNLAAVSPFGATQADRSNTLIRSLATITVAMSSWSCSHKNQPPAALAQKHKISSRDSPPQMGRTTTIYYNARDAICSVQAYSGGLVGQSRAITTEDILAAVCENPPVHPESVRRRLSGVCGGGRP